MWYHVFTSSGYNHGPSVPLIIFFWIFLLGTILRKYVDKLLQMIFNIRKLEIDEDLDNYFNTIDDNDRHWSTTEEQNARECLGLKVLSDETL